jgi:molybdopterin converting factor small subunit
VQINLYATFRLIARTKSVWLEMDAASPLQIVLEMLIERYPDLGPQMFDARGQLYGYIHLFVNRKDISYLSEGQRLLLQPGDTLDIFPPIAGGV